ncbi:MAG: hypothetical protein EP329_21690 [Deltaproteobacteria bacterium]|nr:MAG: hypothetical protein EP329_21690 [Deltaproteobacteria bacterium]
MRVGWALFAGLVWLQVAGCLEGAPEPSSDAQLAVAVAPLRLPGVEDADYTLTVLNGPGGTGETVWTRAVSSRDYGDGAGSLSYVGPCDASTGTNTVRLTLDALYDADGALAPGSFMNPTPLMRDFTCLEGRDVAVDFDVTLARRAEQGFFDVAVAFLDIFCSAKLDCQTGDGQDLALLHDASGARGLTAVMAFACTGSLTGSTYLYMDDPIITCTGPDPDAVVTVDASALGQVDLAAAPNTNPGGYLFAAAVYRGREELAHKAYWSVAFGLRSDAFATAGACTLSARATASAAPPFPQQPLGFPLPAGSVYPVVTWDVPLTSETGRVCGTDAVDAPGSHVVTVYEGDLAASGGGGAYLAHRYDPTGDPGAVLSAGNFVCDPACDHGVCNAASECVCDAGYSGESCDAPVCTAPCEHGGVCVAPDLCDCTGTGYEGASCATDVDECAAGLDLCAPTATCVNDPGTYHCVCAAGTWDTLCDQACTAPHCTSGVTCDAVTGEVTACATCEAGWYGTTCDTQALTGCAELRAAGVTTSGTYTIDPDGAAGPIAPLSAYCDMSWDGGGWTLILSTRVTASEPEAWVEGPVAPGTTRYLPLATMQALADLSTTVHIRTIGDPTNWSITSVPNSVAIANLRAGVLLNNGASTGGDDWTGPQATARTWYVAGLCNFDGLVWPMIYWACGNSSGGLHLGDAFYNTTPPIIHTWGGANPWDALEVYVR